MTKAMGAYLEANLWRSFACGGDSFIRLRELYSFSAIPLENEKASTAEFLEEFAREIHPDSQRRTYRLSKELKHWFQRDWLTLERADELVSSGFRDFPHIGLGTLPPYRALLSLLIFHPHRVQARWVERLWRETLERHEGNSVTAEIELLFLCEQGQQPQRFMEPKPQDSH